MLEVDGATVVARELRRPLLELRQLALGFDGNGTDDEKIRLEMLAVTERAMKQVNDLVRLEKINNGGYKMEPIAVRWLCDDVLDEVAELFGRKRCDIRVKYCNRARLIMANSELLKSVVRNFLLNAVHYNNEEMRAELKVCEIKGKVEIAVRDYGPMLPKNVWHEMREQFVFPQEIAMRPGSSVLGLYLASKFSKYMKAEVGAVRHRDGASFFVKLPVTRQVDLWG